MQIEDWSILVPDPRHTHGRTTQYKQSVHLYVLIKSIVAKAIITSPIGSVNADPSFQEFHKNIQLIQFQIQQRNVRLRRIEQHISSLPESELPSSSSKDPAPVESSNE